MAAGTEVRGVREQERNLPNPYRLNDLLLEFQTIIDLEEMPMQNARERGDMQAASYLSQEAEQKLREIRKAYRGLISEGLKFTRVRQLGRTNGYHGARQLYIPRGDRVYVVIQNEDGTITEPKKDPKLKSETFENGGAMQVFAEENGLENSYAVLNPIENIPLDCLVDRGFAIAAES